MRLKAYVLAADPTWLEFGIGSYYGYADQIIVSYDESGRAWTGAKLPMDDCLRRFRAFDKVSKFQYSPGTYARPAYPAMRCETHQRQCALDEIGASADWILQLDPDEVLPRPEELIRMLEVASEQDIEAVEWPMRVLFRALPGGRFLEVCGSSGEPHYEYPGSIAVRPGVRLAEGRRVTGRYLRAVPTGDHDSLQLLTPPGPNETRLEIESAAAIVHNSWARSPSTIRRKIMTWGHSAGWKSWLFYWSRWYPAPSVWRHMRDFHPFARGLWPRLKVSEFVLERPRGTTTEEDRVLHADQHS